MQVNSAKEPKQGRTNVRTLCSALALFFQATTAMPAIAQVVELEDVTHAVRAPDDIVLTAGKLRFRWDAEFAKDWKAPERAATHGHVLVDGAGSVLDVGIPTYGGVLGGGLSVGLYSTGTGDLTGSGNIQAVAGPFSTVQAIANTPVTISGIAISDVDAGTDLLTVTLSVSDGTLDFTSGTNTSALSGISG